MHEYNVWTLLLRQLDIIYCPIHGKLVCNQPITVKYEQRPMERINHVTSSWNDGREYSTVWPKCGLGSEAELVRGGDIDEAGDIQTISASCGL